MAFRLIAPVISTVATRPLTTNLAVSNYREKSRWVLETWVNVLCREGFAESFDQSYSLRLACCGVRRLVAALNWPRRALSLRIVVRHRC